MTSAQVPQWSFMSLPGRIAGQARKLLSRRFTSRVL
jgi:hypothetical protein